MRILILGAGAIGGYVGGWLASVGADVTFLLRGGRLAHVREHGLKLESTHGNLDLPVQTVSAEQLKPEHDLLVVACKAYDLEPRWTPPRRGSRRTARCCRCSTACPISTR